MAKRVQQVVPDEEGDPVSIGGPEPLDEPVPRTALDLDRLIHERMRLGIVSALAVNDHLSFNDLKKLLQTTDGNLSVHARKLEEGGYLTCEKYFEGRMPKTDFRLTGPGRQALQRYLDHMEAIIQATREG
ncbi:MAG TPA: transcriptional regulator [Thermoanaerobaculia bacterium]|nr:transcriptional regulator [Thermoanaerobaculia bacterium]